MIDPGWVERAACLGINIHVFFPSSTGAFDPYETARSYCNRCEVRQECLDEAMETETNYRRSGMRGGKTPGQRNMMERERGRANA